MDKYKVILRIEETKRLASVKKYKEAYEEMKFLNLAKMKNYEDLIIFADIFVRNKKYVEAKELLERLHAKTVTRRLLTQLIFVSSKTKNFVDAEKYYEEYVKIAPKDINRYVLRYRIDKEKGLSKEVLIKTLEELKEYDYVEEWAYELAKLYHKAGRSKECIRECSNIELWFGDGIIVEKAKLLREHHISALSDQPLGKLSNEVMDFTATGKLIDLLGIVPETKSEEDSFVSSSDFERDNDKVEESNRKVIPEYKEEEYVYQESSGAEMTEVNVSEEDEKVAEPEYDEEQVDAMLGQILEDAKPAVDEKVEEQLDKILPEENGEKPRKHNSFMEAFRNMLFIRDFEGEEKDEEENEDDEEIEDEESNEELDEASTNASEEAQGEPVIEEEINQEAYDEEEEEVKVELNDADFDPQLLELEKIIVASKSQKEIDAQAKDVARDIRKDLAQEISSYVEEDEKVRSEFKEDMQELDAMATKRIISVDDILEQLDENKAVTQEIATDEVEEALALDAKPEEAMPEETMPEEAKPLVDEPQPVIDEPTQRENVEEVLAKTAIPEKMPKLQDNEIKNAKISEEVFRNFAKNEALSDELTKAFAMVKENRRCANFIISGERKTGKSTLAKMITKQLKDMGALSTGKVARIDASRFNNVDLELKQDSLADCCLIINNAHEISPYAITGLISMLIKFNGRTMVILETSKEASTVLEKTSEVSAYFTNVIEMPKYTVADLIEFGHSYADLNEYRMNDSAVFAFRSILDEKIDSISQTEAVEYVIDVLDNAMTSAQNRNRNKLKEILTLKTTDFDGFNEIDMQDIMPL